MHASNMTEEQVQNVKRLIRAVRDLPDEQFEMTYWGSIRDYGRAQELPQQFKAAPGCGTAMCLAGTLACITPGYALYHLECGIGDHRDHLHMSQNCSIVRDEDGLHIIVTSEFSPLLGFSPHLLDSLFTEPNTYGQSVLADVTKADALRTLAGLLRDGEQAYWDEEQFWVDDEDLDPLIDEYCEEVGPVWPMKQAPVE